MSHEAASTISNNTSSFFRTSALRESADKKKPLLTRKTTENNLPSPNLSFFTSMESCEKTAINMLSGFITKKQIESLPETVRHFVAMNPAFIRSLVKEDGAIAEHLLLLNYSELMQLYRYRHNLNQLLDAGISMQALLSLDSTTRNIVIYNAEAIVSLMRQGNTFEALSSLSNVDLMHCVQGHHASEASQRFGAAAQ